MSSRHSTDSGKSDPRDHFQVDRSRDDAARHDNPKTGADTSNRDKDPDDWTTGDEPMTGAQASYLKTLSEEAGEAFDDGLSKAEASRRIDALQDKTGRGK